MNAPLTTLVQPIQFVVSRDVSLIHRPPEAISNLFKIRLNLVSSVAVKHTHHVLRFRISLSRQRLEPSLRRWYVIFRSYVLARMAVLYGLHKRRSLATFLGSLLNGFPAK